MSRVFADTFYFLAVLNRQDPAHAEAMDFYGDASLGFVTTEWVLTEMGDAMAKPGLRPNFQRLIGLLEKDPQMTVIPASRELFHRGLALYFARPDKEWSLTNCISFVVMQDEGLTDALTGDHHFAQANFAVLL